MKHWIKEKHYAGEGYDGYNGIVLKGDRQRILAAIKEDGGIKLIEQCDEHFQETYTPDEIIELATELIEWVKSQ